MTSVSETSSTLTVLSVICTGGVSRHVSCLETWSFMSRSWLSLDTCMSYLGSVSTFHVSSCLMSYTCVLTVSLSGTAKHRHFLLKVGHYAHLIAVYLVTVKRLFCGCCCFIAIMYLDNCRVYLGNISISNILISSQPRLDPIFNVLARLVSWHMCPGKYISVSEKMCRLHYCYWWFVCQTSLLSYYSPLLISKLPVVPAFPPLPPCQLRLPFQ